MTIHWKAIEQYFTVVLFVFHFNPVCKFGKFIRFWTWHCQEQCVRNECVKSGPRNLSKTFWGNRATEHNMEKQALNTNLKRSKAMLSPG